MAWNAGKMSRGIIASSDDEYSTGSGGRLVSANDYHKGWIFDNPEPLREPAQYTYVILSPPKQRLRRAQTSGHQVDGFKDLKRPYLPHRHTPVQMNRSLRTVAPYASDKMWPSVDQRSQQVVKSRVKILGKGWYRLVSVQPARLNFSHKFSIFST